MPKLRNVPARTYSVLAVSVSLKRNSDLAATIKPMASNCRSIKGRFLLAIVVCLQVEIANDVCGNEAYEKVSIHCFQNLNVQSNSGLPLCSTIWRKWRARLHSIV